MWIWPFQGLRDVESLSMFGSPVYPRAADFAEHRHMPDSLVNAASLFLCLTESQGVQMPSLQACLLASICDES